MANRHNFRFFTNGEEAIVAIIEQPQGMKRFKLAGTGFFIAPGVVATAKHLFYDQGNETGSEFWILQKVGEEVREREIDHLIAHSDRDLALCVLSENNDANDIQVESPIVGTMEIPPDVHEVVGVFSASHTLVGSPNSVDEDSASTEQRVQFRTHWELGTIEEEDVANQIRPRVDGTSYVSSVFSEGRASGAPFFNSHGFVVGVSVYGLTPAVDEEIAPYSISLDIAYVVEMEVDGTTVRDIRKYLPKIDRLAFLVPAG